MGIENGSSSQFTTLHFYHSFLLTLLPCPNVGSSHAIQSFMYGPFLHARVLSMGCSSSRTALEWVLSHRVRLLRRRLLQHGTHTGCSSCQKTCSFLSISPQAAAPARSLLQRGLSTGCIFLQGVFTCSTVGSSTSCHVEICSGMGLHGLQGGNLLHHGLLHGLQGAPPHSAPGASPPPPS